MGGSSRGTGRDLMRPGSSESARQTNRSLQKGIRFAGDCFAQVEFAKV